jgi:hypothetical protein
MLRRVFFEIGWATTGYLCLKILESMHGLVTKGLGSTLFSDVWRKLPRRLRSMRVLNIQEAGICGLISQYSRFRLPFLANKYPLLSIFVLSCCKSQSFTS